MSGDIHTTAGKLEDLQARINAATHAGSERAIEKQHAKGKMTARERIAALVDADSFTEFDELARHRSVNFDMPQNRPYGDGVVTGIATVDGRPIALFSQDFTVMGGSLGEVFGEKINGINRQIIRNIVFSIICSVNIDRYLLKPTSPSNCKKCSKQ